MKILNPIIKPFAVDPVGLLARRGLTMSTLRVPIVSVRSAILLALTELLAVLLGVPNPAALKTAFLVQTLSAVTGIAEPISTPTYARSFLS
jgi:hypothetical protein